MWRSKLKDCGWDALVNSANKRGPVQDGSGHVAAEDEVKRALVYPWAFDVVNLKPHVWRHPRGLYGAQIVSENLKGYPLVFG